MQSIATHKICHRCFSILHKVGFKTSISHKANSWTSKEVRKAFLDFFCNKYDHRFVPSSSVIPKKGEGTYFTNAGMNQFKPIFLGTVPVGSELETYKRAANSQKCIRVGGKHNDLEDVGKDLTHHTFFEMLGSWSFGDYFKKEACVMALELLRDVYKLPLHRLYFSYFGGDKELGLQADEECRNIWLELGIPVSHILPLGMKENFWDMGDVGPCGPCTEIHYCFWGSEREHSDPEISKNVRLAIERGSSDVMEVWNLVFMQFERQVDQSLRKLPKQHVDTGMGLERMCAILEGTLSNYNTDLFLPLFKWICETTGAKPYRQSTSTRASDGRLLSTLEDVAYRIVADHSRMFTVCLADGLLPARTGVEQKLRTLMYRSFKQFYSLCQNDDRRNAVRLSGIVPLIAESLGEAFPEISSNVGKIKTVVEQTEEKYRHVIDMGKSHFLHLPDFHNLTALSGEHIKLLHDHSIPLDMIEDLAEAHGMLCHLNSYHELILQDKVDVTTGQDGVEAAQFQSQSLAERLESASVLKTDDSYKYSYLKVDSSDKKYDLTREANKELQSNKILAIIVNNELQESVSEGVQAALVLEKTPFYTEMGGQDGDKGVIYCHNAKFEVQDTQTNQGYVLHIGTLTHQNKVTTSQHEICLGDEAEVHLDWNHRLGCMRNHTAIHLLNAALRKVFGDVKQRGSSVGPDKFSFDFACIKNIQTDNLRQIEVMVQNTINMSLIVDRNILPLHEALQMDGVVSLENEVYPNEVYVISVIDPSDKENMCQSTELCGGTHVHNTADIECFCVCSASGVAQGIKRMVCLTGSQAQKAIEAGEYLKTQYEKLSEAVRICTQPEHWTKWQTEINAALTDDLLPKLVRDELREKMALLGSDIATKQNKLQIEALQKDILNSMTDTNTRFVVRHIAMKTLKNVTSLLEKLKVEKPVIVVVEYTKGTGILISLPEGSEGLKTFLLDQFRTDAQITNSKGLTVIKSKQKNSQHLVDSCERILSDFMKERIQIY